MAQVLGISVGAPNLFGEQTASVLFTGINKNGGEDTATIARLQYFPESLSDSRAVNYETKEIPGGSHPLYQWVSGGARELSLTAVFTQELRLQSVEREVTGELTFDIRRIGVSPEKHSVNIVAAIAWLRQFTYPSYAQDGRASPPLRVRLTFPGMGLGRTPDGSLISDSLLTIMTGCDVEYMQWWPDGSPKYATVSLTFAEIVQDPRSVQFHSSDALHLLGRDYVSTNSKVVRSG